MNIIKQYKQELELILNQMRHESSTITRTNLKHHSRWLLSQISLLSHRPIGM